MGDFTPTDAGNYEGALYFGPEDFAEPNLIRKTLQSGPPVFARSVGGPLPGCCRTCRKLCLMAASRYSTSRIATQRWFRLILQSYTGQGRANSLSHTLAEG